MSVCIKPDLFDLNKIILTDENEKSIKANETNFSFKKRNILYKYDFNVFKELQIITNYIDILKCFKKYDKIKFVISDQYIVDIYNLIQNKINAQYNIKKRIIDIDNPAQQIETDELWICDKKNIDLYFINNVSELILHPSKKSNLLKYNLIKTENSNQIKRYFPCINKDDNNDEFKNMHSGKFLLKFEIINNKLKCVIINGELKYTKSYVQSELKSTNIYKSNIMIEL